MKRFFIGLLALIVIGGIYSATKGGSGDSSDEDAPGSDDQKTMAMVMCEEFVDRTLKAPGTAEYGGLSDATITYEAAAETYTVRNYVDAENSFGAMLRSNFVCEVKDAGNDEWELVDLTGIE